MLPVWEAVQMRRVSSPAPKLSDSLTEISSSAATVHLRDALHPYWDTHTHFIQSFSNSFFFVILHDYICKIHFLLSNNTLGREMWCFPQSAGFFCLYRTAQRRDRRQGQGSFTSSPLYTLSLHLSSVCHLCQPLLFDNLFFFYLHVCTIDYRGLG